MNFLAHIYLSYNHKDIMIGNFIADHIKGNNYKHYNKTIQKGIILHRAIDTFTDAHSVVRLSKRRLHERYGHYDGIIIDIFYDYFLAKNWAQFSNTPLKDYTKGIYVFFESIKAQLPVKSQEFIKYMVAYDILYNYSKKEGIQKVLNGMNARTKGRSKMNLALEDLIVFETELEADFFSFFKDLEAHVKQQLKKLL